MQESDTTAGLRGIDSVDGTVAWASGTNGTVLKTIDTGAHWTRCAIPDAATDGVTLDFRGVQAWDAETAIVMASGPGEKSRLYKTTDGCKTWKLIFKNPDKEGFFDSFYFPKSQSTLGDHEGFGLLLGDPVGGQFAVFETRDGGYSWTRIENITLEASGIDAGAFAASNSCISGTGGARFNFVVGGKSGSFLLRLNYVGHYWLNDASVLKRTWTRQSLPMERGTESAGAFSHSSRFLVKYDSAKQHILDLRSWEVAVGGDYTKPNESTGTAAWSGDSGSTWTASATPPHGYRSAVQWSESLRAWITVGTNGSDISRDDGKTWQPLDNGNWNALSLPFVVGPNGRIARMNPAALPAGN
jgi:photosystem II stability/assembly factor-like uncharacterized protein